MRTPILLLFVLLAAGCGGDEGQSGQVAVPDAGPRAVRPYTAEALRRGCPVGRMILTRLTTADVVYIRTEFLSSTSEGYRKRSQMFDDEMEPLLDASERDGTWQGDADDVAYLPETITVSEETLPTALGALLCWHYVIVDDRGWREDVWYAKDLPGPPVRLESHLPRGTRLRLVEIVENTMPDGR